MRVHVYVSRETLVRSTVIRHESSARSRRIRNSRYSAGHEHDDHLQGSLARARNVVSGDGRRPIARFGARSEAVPRARSGTSSLTVGRSPRADARGRSRVPSWTRNPGGGESLLAELSKTKLELYRDIEDLPFSLRKGEPSDRSRSYPSLKEGVTVKNIKFS